MTTWTSYYKRYSWKSQTHMVGTTGNNNNNASIRNLSQSPLFATVGAPTNELLSGTGLAPDNEGSNGVQRTEGGLCQQQPALSFLQPKEATSPWLHALNMDLQPCLRVRAFVQYVANFL